MKFQLKALVVIAVLALSAAPAFGAGRDDHPTGPPEGTETTPPENDGTAHKPATPGPKASPKAKAKAYGTYCKDQSKKRVEGEKGTPFSKCVTAMAKLANGNAKNPRTACKDLSKKRVEGEKGTPFSRCVSGGAKLLKDQEAAEEEETTTPES